MRLDDEERSSNFEVQQGGGGLNLGGGGGGLLPMVFGLVGSRFGCGGIVVLVIVLMVFGMNPLSLIGGGSPQTQPATQTAPDQITPLQDVSLRVLGSTERRWADIFAANNARYRPTTLVFYSRSGQSGCGAAQSAMGPFYCPSDSRIYLDTDFFAQMERDMGASGDFVIGYVIAHEVGHHIQTIQGIADKVRSGQARVSEAEGNALQVQMELQADCYAGVWAARDTNLMEPGDLEEGLRAAAAIGDDTLQKQSQGRVVPESFTHGSSAQRQQWLQRGLQTGNPAACDTFSGAI